MAGYAAAPNGHRVRSPGIPCARQHGGQQPIVPSDFALIPKLVNESDAAITRTDKAGNKKSLVRKEIGAPPTW